MAFPKLFQRKVDLLYRGIYSTDASIYQLLPLAVETPGSREEVLQIVRDCASRKQPLLARGAGTSLTGQSINNAVVLDLSKHLNRILEINLEQGWVRVESGVVCGELNACLKPYGVHFAPDPATENRATIGGMIANNSAGMRSILHGMTIDHVLELDIALASGEVLKLQSQDVVSLSAKCAQQDREGEIYRGVQALVTNHADEIQRRYPKVTRRSGGYALDALLDVKLWNLAKIVCGSEGTLGIVLEAKLRLTSLPKYSALCLAHFSTLDASLRAAVPIVEHGASAVELIDGLIINQARMHPLTQKICNQIQGNPTAILVIEAQGDSQTSVQQQIYQIADALAGLAYAAPVMTKASEINSVWLMRSSSLGLMTTLRGPRKPTPYIEDAAVPLEVLADYVREVLAICSKYNHPVSLFGHVSVGLVHIRPLHDLHEKTDIEQMKQIQEEVFPLVVQYGGSWSGEHGDGIVRGAYNRQFFGEALYESFRQLKLLFDPDGRMNPGKIIAPPPIDSHLRFGTNYQPIQLKTRFHYRDHGGMLPSVEQCSGVGACRKTLSGVMCPSYIATRDELHSTRGRANALRLVMTGQLGMDGLASEELAAAMDLCLACTGCKSECPNGVDMARLKAEVLQAQRDKYGIRLRTSVFANLPTLGRLATGPQALFINPLLNSKFARTALGRLLQIAPERRLPNYALQCLSNWFAARKGRQKGKQKVLLFNDTYIEYFLPDVGRAAVECLEAAGYEVMLATVGDSQRIAISLGLLDNAKKKGHKLLQKLDALLEPGMSIVVCEPSCASALTHDLPDLIDDEALATRVASRVVMIDAFIERELSTGRITFDWRKLSATNQARHFIVHNHCHQITLDGGRSTSSLLLRIPGAIVSDTNAGCCGMAGSFGYDAEHAALSKTIAEQRLLPYLSKAPGDALIISNGFSCRHQITELSNRRPMHVAEALRKFIQIKGQP